MPISTSSNKTQAVFNVNKSTYRMYLKGLWSVFSSTIICVYSWSLIIFFWDVPSFLMRYTAIDIISYIAYQFMFALFESIVVTSFIALLSLIFPANFIRNNFHSSGPVLVFAFAFNAFGFKQILDIANWVAITFSMTTLTAIQVVFGTWVTSFFLLPVGLVIASKNEKIKRAINFLVEQLSVLAGLYIALSLLSILLIIIRNIN